MATRFSFGVFGQGSGDLQPNLIVEIKTTGTSTVLASTASGSIIDNGDGTYFTDVLDTSNVDVFVGGSLHEEMTNQFVATDEIKTHMVDDTLHRPIDDGAGNGATTKLWSADKIYDYTNATFEGKDSTLMKEGEVDGTSLEFATTLHLKDLGVINAKLGNSAVTTGKIDDLAVTNAKMATNSVGTTEIIDGSVTATEIANLSVLESKIAYNAITPTQISHHTGYGVISFGSSGVPQFGKINTDHIEGNAVSTAKLDEDCVTESKMADNAVGAPQIKHHTGYGAVVFSTAGVPSYDEVNTDHLADLAVTGDKLATNAVDSDHYVDGSIDRAHLANDIIDETKIADGAITSDKLNASVGLTPTDDTIDPDHFKVPASGTAGFAEQAGTDGLGGIIASLPSYASGDEFKWLDLKFNGMNVVDSSNASNGKLQKTISIDQSFTSENYISSDKTLLQNMDILDQRLGYLTQFSGTEGLYTILATNDWDAHNQSSSGFGTPIYEADPTIVEATLTDGGSYASGTFYTIRKINFYKIPDYRQLVLYTRSRVSSATNGFTGKTQITIGGYNVSNQSEASDSINATGNLGELGAIYFDLTSHANYDLYTVNIQFMFDNNSSSGTKDFKVLEWCLIGKRQITVVAGQTTEYVGNPTD